MDELLHLSRRERQIMEAIYAKGEATAVEIVEAIENPPTRTAIRSLLRILEDKGHVMHVKRGREFVYQAIREKKRTAQSAFGRLLQTFFGGSLEKAVASYLSDPTAEVSADELRRLAALIKESAKKGS